MGTGWVCGRRVPVICCCWVGHRLGAGEGVGGAGGGGGFPPAGGPLRGARSRSEIYDSEAIDKLASSYPWLTVTYVVGADVNRPGSSCTRWTGRWPTVTGVRGTCSCGSDEMVSHAVRTLVQAGFHGSQVHHEGLGTQWYGPAWRTAVQQADEGGGPR
ncbi:hypothetical protein NKG94_09430 [Micromonospora sp. M12]